MTKILFQQNDFKYGELDKFIYSKYDAQTTNQLYSKSGMAYIQNFFVNKYGSLSRRYGTKFIAEVKNNNKKTRIIPFSIGMQESYFIELGDQYIRVYSENGIEKDQNNNIIELTTPYLQEHIDTIYNWKKGGSILYITHPKYAPYELIREKKTGYNIWTFQKVKFKLQLDSNNIPIYCGTPTTTSKWQQATGSRMELILGIVNTQQIITSNNQSNYNFVNNVIYRLTYIGAKDTNINQLRVAYIKTTGTGNSVTYQLMGGKITPAGDETGVPKQTPLPLWEIEYGYDESEFPSCVCVSDQRLYFGSGGEMVGSRLTDYSDFGIYEETVGQASPLKIGVFRDNLNNFNWLVDSDTVLYAGTDYEIFRLVKSTASADSSINFSANALLQDTGSAKLPPVLIGSFFLFLERNGLKFRVATYKTQDQFISSSELTETNRNILIEGVKRIVYQTNPNNLIFLIKNNGEVAVCGFSIANGVYFGGWARIKMDDGFIEDACVIPSKTTGRDDVYFIVKRTINNIEQRYIEKYNDKTLLYETHNAENFLDCSITINTPFNITETDGIKYISGFNQLKGKSVYVIFNNNDIRQKRLVTTDGKIKIESTEEVNLSNIVSITCGLSFETFATIPPIDVFFEGRYSSKGEKVDAVDIKIMYQNSILCDIYDRNNKLAIEGRSLNNDDILETQDAFIYEYKTRIIGTKTKRNTYFTLKVRDAIPLPCNIMEIQYYAEI